MPLKIFRRKSSDNAATLKKGSTRQRFGRRGTEPQYAASGTTDGAMTPIMRCEDPVEDYGLSTTSNAFLAKEAQLRQQENHRHYLKQKSLPSMMSIQTDEELHDIINALAAATPPKVSYENNNNDYDDDDEDNIKRLASIVTVFRKLLNSKKPQEAYALISEDIHDIQKKWNSILPIIRN